MQDSPSCVDLAGRRLVIVSNRLPFNVSVDGERLNYQASAGGLVTGLASVRESRKQLSALPSSYFWVGWPGASVDGALREQLTREAAQRFQSFPVFLSAEQMEQFYLGFCNATIWPLFHYFPSFALYQPEYWEQYKQINQLFADSLDTVLRSDDIVWVHDYHLMLLPRLLKARHPGLSVGFFLHIPFPSFEVFRLLPGAWRRDILDGLLGADLIGFHTHEYTHHFLQSVLRILGHEHRLGLISAPDHVTKVETFPMGIDYERFASAAAEPDVEQEVCQLRAMLPGVKLVLSVDRLDYSKGIGNRLEGYELFLEGNPEYHGKVALLMVVVPSRIGVVQYDLMKRQLEEQVGKINGRFGRVGWTPVVYQYRHVPFSFLVALYAVSDLCLVTPLRDGMNLVAKEYLAARRDGTGVLILSEMAGAAKELPEALIVNPNNRGEIAQALKDALAMTADEQITRNKLMQHRLRRYNVNRWADDFLKGLMAMREVQSHSEAKLLLLPAKRELVARFGAAQRRLLLLDYDGTLTPLVRHPALALPGADLLALLRQLAAERKNSVVVTSGRDRDTLEQWFGTLAVGLVAEHGAWLRPAERPWQRAKISLQDWKPEILPILELYADRVPGSFVEEKEESLAWHYRMADPEQADLRAPELVDYLSGLTAKIDLRVVHGNKVVEIRCSGVDKGSAARFWLNEQDDDFVLAIGDDITDEDMFAVLPDRAATIRVGITGTQAKFNLRGVGEVLDLLRALVT